MEMTIQDQVKSQLVEVYNTLKENSKEFNDSNIQTHVGSILNKFFGGINDIPVADKSTRARGKYQTFKPTLEDFKKKSTNQVVAVENDPLSELTLPELKVKAKGLGIKYSNKTRDELIRDINWHDKEIADSKRKPTAKPLDVNADQSDETPFEESEELDFDEEVDETE